MYTYCPNCFAIYQVTTSHLDQAGGQLRCGECRQIYRAIDYLFEDLAAARSVVETQRAFTSQPQELVDHGEREDSRSVPLPRQGSTAERSVGSSG